MKSKICETSSNNPHSYSFVIVKSENESSSALEKTSVHNVSINDNSNLKIVCEKSSDKISLRQRKLKQYFYNENTDYFEQFLNKANEVKMLKIEIDHLKSEKKIASNVISKLKVSLRKAKKKLSEDKKNFKDQLNNKANEAHKFKNNSKQLNKINEEKRVKFQIIE